MHAEMACRGGGFAFELAALPPLLFEPMATEELFHHLEVGSVSRREPAPLPALPTGDVVIKVGAGGVTIRSLDAGNTPPEVVPNRPRYRPD